MRFFLRSSRLHPIFTLSISILLIALSALLLSAHANAVASMRETGLPAALRLLQIEKRAAVLQEQNDAAELQAALRTGTEEEIMRLFVLPEDAALDRLLPQFEALFSYLQQERQLRDIPTMTVGDPEDFVVDSLQWRMYPVRFTVTSSEEGMARIFSFIDIAGMLTVSDYLSQSDIERLLVLTEEQNPAAITALEQFLSCDLLRFAESPQSYKNQLFAALSSPHFAEELQFMLDASDRRAQLPLLRDLAPLLQEKRLWPMRFLSIIESTLDRAENGWVTGTFVIGAAGRPKT